MEKELIDSFGMLKVEWLARGRHDHARDELKYTELLFVWWWASWWGVEDESGDA